MSGEACHLPAGKEEDEYSIIQRLLGAKTIAVVGLSDDRGRPSYGVSKYMLSKGYKIVPVNPKHDAIFGEKCYARLEDIPGKVDLVNVFRRPLACADIVKSAIALGIKGVWLQSGITNDEAEKLAKAAGIDFIQDRCIMVEHMHAGR